MDKVKQILAVAGKHHFWILCAIIAIITLGSWYTSASKLRAEFTANKTKINDAKSKAQGIASTADHPNPQYHEEMDKLTNAYKASLRKLWEDQYTEQGKNLQWPIETDDYRGLTEEFVDKVKDLRPIETTVPPFDPTNKTPDKIKGSLKEQYRDFVKSTELPRLAKIIGAVWQPALMGANGGGDGRNFNAANTGDGPVPIVHWHAENQEYLQNTRFDWSKEPTKLPSTLQILYAQEDLWVLETIINILKKTNRDADARHNAVVKEIKYIKLGADAVGLSGQVMRLESATAVPGTPGVPPAGGQPTTPMTPGDPRALGANTLVQKDPAEGRYVDVAYQPVPPGRLREAFTSTKPEEAFLAVAKRMPVRMHLVIDQRYLNRLLAECGNSNLIIEIRQIRVNQPIYEGGGLAGIGAAPPAPRMAGEGGFGGGGPRRSPTPVRGGGGGRNGEGESPDDERSHYEVDVELYGIVYIYNPVNDAMLTLVGTPDAASAPVAAPPAAAPVAPPVAAPAPAAPVAPMPAVPAAGVPAEGAAPVAPMPVAPVPPPVAPPVAAPGA